MDRMGQPSARLGRRAHDHPAGRGPLTNDLASLDLDPALTLLLGCL